MKDKIFGVLQRVGRSFMLPIALLPVAGLLLGVALHQFVIRTAEIDMVMFGRSIYAPSYLWAALLTVAFSVLVNLVMYRKLTGIRMVESMKAPE